MRDLEAAAEGLWKAWIASIRRKVRYHFGPAPETRITTWQEAPESLKATFRKEAASQ